VSNSALRARYALKVVIGVSMLTACAPKKAAVSNLTADGAARLAAAHELVGRGCYDCLVLALREYGALRGLPSTAEAASTSFANAAVLLSLRQRELGMSDDDYLRQAREAPLNRASAASFSSVLDMVDLLPWRLTGVAFSNDAQLQNDRRLRENRKAWSDELRTRADRDVFSAYAWLALMCASAEGRALGDEALKAPAAAFSDLPLIIYRTATCFAPDTKALAGLLQIEPRFVELNYFLALQEIVQGKLEEADERLQRAYAWHPRWPAVTLGLGNVAMTAEDFERARSFYDETLALAPGQLDAMLGRLRSLSYLGRHEDAIRAADTIVEGNWYRGEALYWRAWNEVQLARLEPAWTDIENAWKLDMTADVAKLAGIIAYRRQQLDVARVKFEEGHRMKPDDCELGFFLGSVLADQRNWTPAADLFVGTASCLENERRQLEEDIARIRASSANAERQGRMVARREQQIANAERMLANSWFNTAVSYFNLSRKAEARDYAQKVASDTQFGERARELLTRLTR
jgi:tetratricopeptide (TPR) repeat protein